MKLIDKKIWLTADLHFGHNAIIEYCKRPFKTTTEMNNTLIKNFNKTIGKNDIVYILGDLSFLNTISTTEIVKNLNGFKFLIKGNHDHKTNAGYRKMGFMEVYNHPIILNNQYILSHEPISGNIGNLINIHGHTHNNVILDNNFNKFCVSVEMTNYKPIELSSIKESIEKSNIDNIIKLLAGEK